MAAAGQLDSTLWISEHDVVAEMDLGRAIDELQAALSAEAAGRMLPMAKTMLRLPGGGTLHSLGAATEDLAGVKTWAHTPGGADPILLLLDARNGRLVAVVEAFALGQLRTAAAAAVATDRMAPAGARVLAVLGTGRQALPQVAAVAAVRRLEEVRVFSPTAAHREAFAGRLERDLGLRAVTAGSPAEAVSGAHVVTLVTRATSPVVTEAMVEEGMHMNSVGSIDLDRREFEPAILAMADLVVTDSMEQAMAQSSELRAFYGPDPSGWRPVQSLAGLVAAGDRRSDTARLSIFKGMGSGVEDLALGLQVLESVRRRSDPMAISRKERRLPRFTFQRPGDTVEGCMS